MYHRACRPRSSGLLVMNMIVAEFTHQFFIRPFVRQSLSIDHFSPHLHLGHYASYSRYCIIVSTHPGYRASSSEDSFSSQCLDDETRKRWIFEESGGKLFVCRENLTRATPRPSILSAMGNYPQSPPQDVWAA